MAKCESFASSSIEMIYQGSNDEPIHYFYWNSSQESNQEI